MQKGNYLPDKLWRKALFPITTLLVVAVDQLSKLWIRSNLAEGHSLPESGFFQLTHVTNSGAAFGMLQGQPLALAVVGLIGVAIIFLCVILIYRHYPIVENKLGRLALGLVLGGTVGNLIDRLSLGYVTDFIDIGIWPAFNLADSAIVVGAFMFFYSLHSAARSKKGRVGLLDESGKGEVDRQF